jgi:lipopolysaccharide transport system permease protein
MRSSSEDQVAGQPLAGIVGEDEWTKTIRPVSGWFDIHLGELWRYRDLIMLFVRRDFVAIYKQTILGPLWYLVQPIMTTLIFTVIFGKVAKISTDGLPPVMFYLSGVVAWRYFADCLQKTSNTFTDNAHMFGKVYFPRLTVPLSVVISNLIAFAIQLVLFAGFWIYFYAKGTAIHLQLAGLLLPILILQMAALGLGCGIIVSSLTTKYRDLTHLVGFGVQLWMYATPVVYPLSIIPEKYQWLMALNPMTPIIEAFRYAFLGVGTVDVCSIATSAAMTLVLLFVGVVLFSRIEKSFMDTV